jgi:hypothetical protein
MFRDDAVRLRHMLAQSLGFVRLSDWPVLYVHGASAATPR